MARLGLIIRAALTKETHFSGEDAMVTCFDVANYFLCLADNHEDDSISNLKLQKLVYYAQGFYLAVYEVPLFNESIVAWQHGPVVEDLYHAYKSFGRSSIPPSENFSVESIPVQARELMDEVYEVYGQYSAWKLRNMTHEESPWLKADASSQGVISHDSMKEFFKTLVQ